MSRSMTQEEKEKIISEIIGKLLDIKHQANLELNRCMYLYKTAKILKKEEYTTGMLVSKFFTSEYFDGCSPDDIIEIMKNFKEEIRESLDDYRIVNEDYGCVRALNQDDFRMTATIQCLPTGDEFIEIYSRMEFSVWLFMLTQHGLPGYITDLPRELIIPPKEKPWKEFMEEAQPFIDEFLSTKRTQE